MPDFMMKREQTFISNGVTMVFSMYPEGIGELMSYTKEDGNGIVGYTTIADIYGESNYTSDFGIHDISHDALVSYLHLKYVGSWKADLKTYLQKWNKMLPAEQEFNFINFHEFVGELSRTVSGRRDIQSLGA